MSVTPEYKIKQDRFKRLPTYSKKVRESGSYTLVKCIANSKMTVGELTGRNIYKWYRAVFI